MRARTVATWRAKLSGACNILALVMIAAVFALAPVSRGGDGSGAV